MPAALTTTTPYSMWNFLSILPSWWSGLFKTELFSIVNIIHPSKEKSPIMADTSCQIPEETITRCLSCKKRRLLLTLGCFKV
jgi:hypothetical protein